MVTHKELMMIIVGYGTVGFFIACLLAGVLSLFKIIKLDEDVRRYLFGTLLASFGAVVIAYFTEIVKTPDQIKSEINLSVQNEATREAREILDKSKDRKLVYIQVAHRAQRDQAGELQDNLVKSGFAAPGIENAWDRSPNDLQVRYCASDEADARKVAAIVTKLLGRSPKLSLLRTGSEETGAIEVWFPR